MRRYRPVLLALLVVAVLTVAAAAWGQQPSPPLPGQEPEVARGIPFWTALPIALGAIGLLFLIGFSYWRLSRRFFARDEPPPVRTRARFAGMAATQPVAAAPQGAPAAAPQAAAAVAAGAGAPVAVKETAPSTSAPAAEPKAQPGGEAKPDRPSEADGPAQPAEKAEAPAKAEGPDQETFDRVLAEQLEKGVDRRVAEGRARAAATKAAREKASGG
jgi:hypothetical protein